MGVTRRALLAIVLLTGCHSADDGASPVVADGATDSTTSDGSTMEETSTKIDAPMETDGSITKSDAVIDTGSTTPIDTGPPETSTANKVVFVTSTLYTGDLGGVAGADSKCQSAAAAASLAGTFKAWVSSATSSPSTTFVRTTGDYALPDGTVVAHGWSGLTSGT
ncbi:MAG: hypothetical protein ACXVEF_31830, partial [Polyangiales bacterium]